MSLRIKKHRERRPSTWETVEEPLDVDAVLDRFSSPENLILIDCLTVLVSNHLLHYTGPVDEANPSGVTTGNKIGETLFQEQVSDRILDRMHKIIGAFRKSPADVVAVTNEVGMGVVPPTPMGRVYRDLMGRVNQAFADTADEFYVIFSGHPLRLK